MKGYLYVRKISSSIIPENRRKLQSQEQVDKIDTLRPRQNGRHLAVDILKCIFLNENVWISTRISLKIFPWGLIDNTYALVQIMAWRQTGDKPLSDPMVGQFIDAYMCHSASMSYETKYNISSYSITATVQ